MSDEEKINLRFQTPMKSITDLNEIELQNFSIFTGFNGTGKTQILMAIGQGNIHVFKGENVINHKLYIDFKNSLSGESEYNSKGSDRPFIESLVSQYNAEGNFNVVENQNRYNANNVNMQIKQKMGNVKQLFQLEQGDLLVEHYYYYEANLSNKLHPFNVPNLSSLFQSYRELYIANKQCRFYSSEGEKIKSLTDDEFVEKYGQDPITIFNEYLQKIIPNYSIDEITTIMPGVSYSARLRDKRSNALVDFSSLSTGEQVLFKLVCAMFSNAKEQLQIPELLLLDELDAGLHPSIIKQVIEIIKTLFLEELNVKVIISTHSPTTVAISEEKSIFLVNRDMPRIEKISKQEALNMLTSELPTLNIEYDARKIVFVESEYDEQNYSKIYDILVKRKFVKSEMSLTFVGSGTNSKVSSGSCDLAVDFVTKLRSSNRTNVFGILDWDLKARSNGDGVKILALDERYSIENCILDPLLIAFLLIHDGNGSVIAANDYTFIDLGSFDNKQLQDLIDQVLSKVSINKNDIVSCEYNKGIALDIPKEYLSKNGHDIESLLKQRIPELSRYQNSNQLIGSVIELVIKAYPEFCPKVFQRVFNDIILEK